MAYETQIEAAKTHFGKILEEQLARVERLKQQPEWLDFSRIKPIKIGMIGGDGIGPTIAIESQKVLEYLLRDQVSSGKVAVRDFRRKKTILLRPGKRYLARAKR